MGKKKNKRIIAKQDKQISELIDIINAQTEVIDIMDTKIEQTEETITELKIFCDTVLEDLSNSCDIIHILTENSCLPRIKKVRYYDDKKTVVTFKDGSKSEVTCSDTDNFTKEAGLALALCKRLMKDDFKSEFEKFIVTPMRYKKDKTN